MRFKTLFIILVSIIVITIIISGLYLFSFDDMNIAAETIREKGSIYVDKGNYKRAIIYYKLAYKIDPENTGILFNLVISYAKSGNYSKALEALEDWHITTDVQYLSLMLYYKYIFLIQMEEFEEALDISNQSIDWDNNAYDYVKRAYCYCMLENYVYAFEDCNYAIDQNSEFAEAYYYRAFCRMKFNDKKEAYNDFVTSKKLGLAITEDYINSETELENLFIDYLD